MRQPFGMLAFGGSGNIQSLEPFRGPLEESLHEGRRMLKMGRSAVDTVVRCVTILEDSPRLNAGIGSALNEFGGLQMEAAVMNGADLSAGSVAGLDSFPNPILVAEMIRQKPDIVKLIGEGARRFALDSGLSMVDSSRLVTERQLRRLARQLNDGLLVIDGEAEGKMGTVGVVARDDSGGLAAATSTGGLLGSRLGRVGDTSTIGAGTYANKKAAISCTGRGEDYIRSNVAGSVAALVEHGGMNLSRAVTIIMEGLQEKGGKGGIIAIGNSGQLMSQKTDSVKGMPHGGFTSDSDIRISLEPTEVCASE